MKHTLLLSAAFLMASLSGACGQAGEAGGTPDARPVAELSGTDTPDGETQVNPTDSPEAILAALPRTIVVDNDVLTADVSIDEAVFSFTPALAQDIVADAQARIDAMEADAKTYQKVDPDYFRPYALKIDWQVTGAAGMLAGLEGFIYTHTGGAHGNYMTDGRIYNTQTGERMRIGDLFSDKEAAAVALAPKVYELVARAKTDRSGSPGSYEMFLGESKDAMGVSDILAGNISLIASTMAGKLGGLALHYAPYEIGSYAEGAYHITLPQADFRTLLKPEYQTLFAGAPAEIQRLGE